MTYRLKVCLVIFIHTIAAISAISWVSIFTYTCITSIIINTYRVRCTCMLSCTAFIDIYVNIQQEEITHHTKHSCSKLSSSGITRLCKNLILWPVNIMRSALFRICKSRHVYVMQCNNGKTLISHHREEQLAGNLSKMLSIWSCCNNHSTAACQWILIADMSMLLISFAVSEPNYCTIPW